MVYSQLCLSISVCYCKHVYLVHGTFTTMFIYLIVSLQIFYLAHGVFTAKFINLIVLLQRSLSCSLCYCKEVYLANCVIAKQFILLIVYSQLSLSISLCYCN